MLSSWYAVHTISGHEGKVSQILRRRAVVEGLWDREIFEILIPTEQAVRTRDGKRSLVERKVFPGYILIKMLLTPETHEFVKKTSGVTGFVSSGNKPVPIEQREIEGVMRRLDESREQPQIAYARGDTVRVIDGPFADYTGKIEEVAADRQKVKVLITIFGRDTPVELEFQKVEKA